MGHIFISYSHKDSSYVHKLVEVLELEGFEVWIDDRIHYGSEWPKVVTRNLDVSDGVIIVLSNNSYDSDMVHNEVTRAREKKKPIFPLLLEGENWLMVQAKQFVDVSNGSLPTEKFYKRLEEITPRKKAEREVAEKAKRDTAEKEKLEINEQIDDVKNFLEEKDDVKSLSTGIVGINVEADTSSDLSGSSNVVAIESEKHEAQSLTKPDEEKVKPAKPIIEETQQEVKKKPWRLISIGGSLAFCVVCLVATISILRFAPPGSFTQDSTNTAAPTFTSVHISFTPTKSTPPPPVISRPSKTLSPKITVTSSTLPVISMSFTTTKIFTSPPDLNSAHPIASSTHRPPTKTPLNPTLPYTPTDIIPLPTFTDTSTATLTSSTLVSVIQSFRAPGSNAEGITWDGANLWLTDNSATVFKVDPSGTTLDSFESPEGTPQGITWDGSNFWIFTTSRNRIYQVQFNGGQTQTVSYFVSPAQVIGGGVTQDMAWDGNTLWYANEFNVYHLDTAGNELSHFAFSQNVMGLDWDGSDLWLAYTDFSGNSTLAKVNTAGSVLTTYPAPIYEIDGLAWANGYLWAFGINTPGGNPMIYKLNIPNQ